MNSVLGRSPDVVILCICARLLPEGRELCSFNKVSIGQMVKMVAEMVSCCSETLAQLYPSDKKHHNLDENNSRLTGRPAGSVLSSLGCHLTIIIFATLVKVHRFFGSMKQLRFVDLCCVDFVGPNRSVFGFVSGPTLTSVFSPGKPWQPPSDGPSACSIRATGVV